MTKQFYRINELSEGWGVSARVLRDLVRTGEVPSVRLGRAILVPAQWVEQKLQEALSRSAQRKAA